MSHYLRKGTWMFRRFFPLIFLGGVINLLCFMYPPDKFLDKDVFSAMKPLTQKNSVEFIVIRGGFDEKGNISVYPLYTVRDTRLPPPVGHGPYTIELQDAGADNARDADVRFVLQRPQSSGSARTEV